MITNVEFYGFERDAAKKSYLLNKLLNHLIASVERDIEIVTSTPKSGSRMEISFSKHYNFQVTLDHDSGYMSHHQESNSDSSLENISEIMSNPSRPIYLSEDALLEKPKLNIKPKNRNAENGHEKTDVTEPKITSTSPDTVLSTSVVSEKTTYSGFDSDSNTSVEIPYSKPIVVEDVDSCIKGNILCNQDLGNENSSALSDITNKSDLKNSEKKKRLTLIFSKNNKENMYSVKRKYKSTSPEKDATPDLSSEDKRLTDKCFIVDNETKQINLNYCENSTEDTSSDKNFISGKDQIRHVNIEDNDRDPGNFDNSESPKGELILRRELELDEIVLQQESSEYFSQFVCQEGKADSPNQKVLGEIANIQQNPSTTPIKKFENPIDPNISPDLFENDEVTQEIMKQPEPLKYIPEEKHIVKKDHRILKRAQNSLKGVLPPHSVTVVQLSVDEILNRLEANKQYFWINDVAGGQSSTDTNNGKLNTSDDSVANGESKSLLITSNKDCIHLKWPQILHERFHGLHYNRSKLSEELEELCVKYGQRYVGAETQSSCTVFESNFSSPTKRKQRQRWAVKSPGRRLSHLAKRRITFSSANLQAGASSSMAGSRARQILVDAKKLNLLNPRRSPRKSPRKNLRRTPRKTPSKSPRLKSRTPSSSAKKKLAMRFRELTGEIENTAPSTSSEKAVFLSKRVLFQSPDRDMKPSLFQPSTSSLSTFDNELKNPATKRALFISPSKSSPMKKSPFKRSPFKRRLELGVERKRKRTDSDDMPPSKLARSVSMDIRPSESETAAKFSRTKSETIVGPSGELSAAHKTKLKWAVYEALCSQNITPTHTQFKLFASVLARVVRRFLPSVTSSGPKECGTTEKMRRIARFHVYAVIKGKSVEEIITEHLKNRARSLKPQGYVGPEVSNAEKKISEVANEGSGVLARESSDKAKLELLGKPKGGVESRIDRIRKVINFGDDNR